MYGMIKQLACYIAVAITVFLTPAVPAKTGAGISAASIKQIVQKEETLESEFKQQVYAAYADGVASVSLFRHPEATKDDCKINAVLLAHKIIALDPHSVKLVRCVFYDYDRQNEFWAVEVRAELVNAFAQGKLGEHELINSIQLTEDRQKNPLSDKFASLSYNGILNADSVCRGACEERRLAIHLRLKELTHQHVDVSRFRDDVLRIEDAARRGKDDAEMPAQLTTLSKNIDDYVQELIQDGQLQKPELRRTKNAMGKQGKPTLDPLKGI